MKRIILFFACVFSLSAVYAQNNAAGTFNYKKWQQEQERKRDLDNGDDAEEISSDNLINSTTLYLDGYVLAGKLHGAGVSIGGFYNNFNAEITYMYGLQESYQIERIYGEAHHYFTYRPSFWGGKLGYGISKLGHIRITPQIGFGVVQIRGKQANETIAKGHDKANVTNIIVDVRLHYNFMKHFGISLIPEYRFNIHESESFLDITDPTRAKVNKLSDTSDLHNWTKGFNCRFALTINF
jgi:hypothetical protein